MADEQQIEWMARVMVYYKREFDVYPNRPIRSVFTVSERKDEMMRLLLRAKDEGEATMKTKCFFDKMCDVTYSILAITPF